MLILTTAIMIPNLILTETQPKDQIKINKTLETTENKEEPNLAAKQTDNKSESQTRTLSEHGLGTPDCNHRVLQYYGLEGWTSSLKTTAPETKGSERVCPGMKYSCCSHNDFDTAKDIWLQSLPRIKGYLTKTFRIIQKIIMMQSSFIAYVQSLSQKAHPACQLIDTTFFNPPVAFDEIHSYLNAALLSMAYIQKGFLCTICDAEKQKFFFQKQDFAQLKLTISEKSCNDLIYRFKEFLMYKVYYLDPFVLNAQRMLVCAGKEVPLCQPEYDTTYQEVRDCIESGINCHHICAEFKYGGVSDLFMGNLPQLEAINTALEDLTKESQLLEHAQNDDIYIPEYQICSNDFFQPEHELNEFEKTNLMVGRVSAMHVQVAPNGIDLFEAAQHSNFNLENQTTQKEKQRIYNIQAQVDEPISLMSQGLSNESSPQVNETNEPKSFTEKVKTFFRITNKDTPPTENKGIFDDDAQMDQLSHTQIEPVNQVSDSSYQNEEDAKSTPIVKDVIQSVNEFKTETDQALNQIDTGDDISNHSNTTETLSNIDAKSTPEVIAQHDDLETAKFNEELNQAHHINLDRKEPETFDIENEDPNEMIIHQENTPENDISQDQTIANQNNTPQNNSVPDQNVISQVDKTEGIEDEMHISSDPKTSDEQEKLNSLPDNNRPSTQELEQVQNEIAQKERENDEFEKENGILKDFKQEDAESKYNDFEGVKDIQDFENMGEGTSRFLGIFIAFWAFLLIYVN